MGEECSNVMERQREERVLRLHEQDLSMQTSCISLYVKSGTKAALFLTFFPWLLFSPLLSLLVFFFFWYSFWGDCCTHQCLSSDSV